jgi:dihydropteroate synthase
MGDRVLDFGRGTLVMGVLNVTPDSFSDGGRFLDHEAAVAHGVAMAQEGAAILDVGGESTRPGSEAVTVEDELSRVLPVVKRLAAEVEGVDLPISIDTRKPEVARAAVDAGAVLINDVSGAREPGMLEVVAATGAGLVLMHMLGEPKTMQAEPTYEDVVREVHDYLSGRIEAAEAAGLARDRLAVDPGLGFGKNFEHSLELMRKVDAFLDLGVPVVVGPSRKSFIGTALGDAPVEERLEGTIGAAAWMAGRGVHVVRVHDVGPVVRALRVVDEIRGPR